ncbi:hypothetical protein MTO96_009130 [Rhipicephalus appendiculatus]
MCFYRSRGKDGTGRPSCCFSDCCTAKGRRRAQQSSSGGAQTASSYRTTRSGPRNEPSDRINGPLKRSYCPDDRGRHGAVEMRPAEGAQALTAGP